MFEPFGGVGEQAEFIPWLSIGADSGLPGQGELGFDSRACRWDLEGVEEVNVADIKAGDGHVAAAGKLFDTFNGHVEHRSTREKNVPADLFHC